LKSKKKKKKKKNETRLTQTKKGIVIIDTDGIDIYHLLVTYTQTQLFVTRPDPNISDPVRNLIRLGNIINWESLGILFVLWGVTNPVLVTNKRKTVTQGNNVKTLLCSSGHRVRSLDPTQTLTPVTCITSDLKIR